MKDKGTAYILWILGIHRFYLGQPLIGLIQLLTVGGFLIWWIVDGFRMNKLVRKANDKYYYDNYSS